jgi:hypothetical protein
MTSVLDQHPSAGLGPCSDCFLASASRLPPSSADRKQSGGSFPDVRFAAISADADPLDTLRGIFTLHSLRERIRIRGPVKMETTGFEPVTPCLQSRCSTS